MTANIIIACALMAWFIASRIVIPFCRAMWGA